MNPICALAGVWLSISVAIAADPTAGLVTIDNLRMTVGAGAALFETEASSFEMASSVPNNASVTCHILRPKSATPRRDDLVLYLQHPQEQIWKSDLWRRIAQESGFTVCGLFFAGMGKDDIDLYADRKNSYFWAESGSITALTAAVAEVRRRLSLPDRGVLVIGNSGGGTLAQHVAALAQGIDGGVALGGCAFITNSRFRMPFLVLNTYGDETLEAARKLVLFRALTCEPTLAFESMPNWLGRGRRNALFHHCIGESAFRLALRYLEALADLRREHGAIPQSSLWPLAADPMRPTRIAITTAVGWRESLASAAPVMLPSPAVALAWLDITRPPTRNIPFTDALWAAPAPGREASGIALVGWVDGRQEDDLALRLVNLAEWDTLQAADAGLHGLWSPTVGAKPAELLAGLIQSNPAMAELPVQVLLSAPTSTQLGTASRLKRVAGLVVALPSTKIGMPLVPALVQAAKTKISIEVLLFETGGDRGTLATALKDKIGISVHAVDPAGQTPQWEHASAMRLLLQQSARLAKAKEAAPTRPRR